MSLAAQPISGADDNEAGKRGAQPLALIKSQVQWTRPINVDDYKFLAANSDLMPKITIPGPCALHFRGGDQAVKAHAYRDMDDVLERLPSMPSPRNCKRLAAAGCRYVQIDETAFAKFGDPEVQATLAARGDDWNALIDTLYRRHQPGAARRAEEMRIGMHLCRGNRGGQWHCAGRLRFGRRPTVQRARYPVLLPRIRYAARRHLHAAAVRAAQQDGRSSG